MIDCIKIQNKICLPDIVKCEDFSQTMKYMDYMYDIFKRDFINNKPQYQGKDICIRREPMDGNREHAFIHMTHEDFYHKTGDPNDRVPDFKRSERLPWVKYVIENYNCSIEQDCGKILYWEEMYRGYVRINLLYEEERFLVVLEKRLFGYLLITSFYLDKEWAMEKRLKKYKEYKKQKTPLI